MTEGRTVVAGGGVGVKRGGKGRSGVGQGRLPGEHSAGRQGQEMRGISGTPGTNRPLQ